MKLIHVSIAIALGVSGLVSQPATAEACEDLGLCRGCDTGEDGCYWEPVDFPSPVRNLPQPCYFPGYDDVEDCALLLGNQPSHYCEELPRLQQADVNCEDYRTA